MIMATCLPTIKSTSIVPSPAPGVELSDSFTATRQGTIFLVIDDEEGVRAVMARMLGRMGYIVAVAPDGASGLELLAGGLDGLRGIFLDVTVSGSSGEALIQQIQAQHPGIPIILMSGYSVEDIAQHYPESSLHCFLQKPFTRSSLQAALAAVFAL